MEVGKPKGKLNIILELNAAAALERMGWLRVNEAWSKEITVGGEPHTSYIPGPATKALAFAMRAKAAPLTKTLWRSICHFC
jgi:hypothetical protein